jgi:hypothetical protein
LTAALRAWLTGLTFFVAGCCAGSVKGAPMDTVPAIESVSYGGVNVQLGEHLYPNEMRIADELSIELEESVRKQFGIGKARRDAHPKAHGCVKAQFRVLDSVPNSLAKGIFIPGKTYEAWIRFSNGSGDPNRADIKRDARGMAIKVLGVPGEKLLQDEEEAQTQDFILINHPVFFASDPARYLAFMQDADSPNAFRKLLIPFALGAKGTLIALETRHSRIANPLQVRYWSMVPYQLGADSSGQAVKYSVRSCSATVDELPNKPAHDFLRGALRDTLKGGDACMEFLVQPRTSKGMDVEDSRIEWKEAQAPFYKVATILVPRQVFDTPEQNAFCENLSFTPWHALPEHKPLGVTNRLRKVIYNKISLVRHQMNGVIRQEPP